MTIKIISIFAPDKIYRYVFRQLSNEFVVALPTVSRLETIPKKYDMFVNNLLLRRGIERNIEIIGETMSRILRTNDTVRITNARKIVDTRNYIIHGYDTLTVDILWSIVVNHLPLLKTEVENLLAE